MTAVRGALSPVRGISWKPTRGATAQLLHLPVRRDALLSYFGYVGYDEGMCCLGAAAENQP